MVKEIDYTEIKRFLIHIPDLKEKWIVRNNIVNDLILHNVLDIKHTRKGNEITSTKGKASNPFVKNIRRFEKENQLWLKTKKEEYHIVDSKGKLRPRVSVHWKIDKKGLERMMRIREEQFAIETFRILESFLDFTSPEKIISAQEKALEFFKKSYLKKLYPAKVDK